MKIVKYFFEFISIISLFCIFRIIGLRNASNLGSILGRSIGPLFRSKDITKQNIKIGLGNIDEKKEAEIIDSMWSNLGRTFSEYIFLKDFKFNKTNFDHIKIDGINYLDQIKKENNAILITTEKDYFRIKGNIKKYISYLKIKVEIQNQDAFIEEIKKII